MKGCGSIGILAIDDDSGKEVTRAPSNNNGSGGELVEAEAEVAAGKEGEVEGEEASVGLGRKFGKKIFDQLLK